MRVARVVRVLPDVPAIDRAFDYRVPERWDRDVRVGTRVRVALHGRRVGGWVIGDDVTPPEGIALRDLAGLSGCGPPPVVLDLSPWAAWRWAGSRAHFLRTASPERVVRSVADRPPEWAGAFVPSAEREPGEQRRVLRRPPAADLYPAVAAEADAALRRRTSAVVVAPSHTLSITLAQRLRRGGFPVALMPAGWAEAAGGARVVVGTRAAAWAPVADLGAAVVVDAHDEALVSERAPTWSAWVVVAERAARAGASCTLISPCPTLEQLSWGQLVAPARDEERGGWAVLETVDMRDADPRSGMFSSRVVDAARSGGRIVCVLNRKGRARLLACGSCGALATCERCEAAVSQMETRLSCARCGVERPPLCAGCGSQRLRALRLGVTRAAEELSALVGEPVVEVTGDKGDPGAARVVIGTEATLHRVPRADVVIFLEVDQELLAPRFRAAEQALALLARASRLVGGRAGRVIVQTRVPSHGVLHAALHADPGRLVATERSQREVLGLPPTTAMAAVSGDAAPEYVARLPADIDVGGPPEGPFLVRAPDHRTLCDALASAPRAGGRLRVEVDPLRV